MKKSLLIFIFTSIVLLNCTCLAIEPSNNKIYKGIDVSQWQREIDFKKVKKSGIEIVYIKASQGNHYVDPYFERNYKEAKRENLKIGFYHFLTAKNLKEAIDEADFFSAVISNKDLDCLLAMDFENFGRLSKKEINDISKEFLKRVEKKTNKKMIIYSDSNNVRKVFDKSLAKEYPLWIAEYDVKYPKNIKKWNTWVGYQYTDNKKISGIKNSVDADYYTSDVLLKNNKRLPKNKHRNKKDNYYKIIKVSKGDTLSKIAIRYNTSIEEIVELNKIRNRNLIYIGEKLKIYESKYNNIGETNHYIYTVKRGDTLSGISRKFRINLRNIIKINNIKNPNLIYAGERLRVEIK